MSRVFIGVGHGGADPGAIGGGLEEKNVNLAMALACKQELERHGVTVGISRMVDEDDPLVQEIQEANAFAPDLAVDVHNNAGGGDGFEVYRQTGKHASKSLKLAAALEARVKELGQNSRGVKTRLNASGQDYYGWLRQVNAPAVLCEGAFLDTTDREAVDSPQKQENFGIAYAKAILDVLGISWKEEKTLYRVQTGAFGNRENALKYAEKLMDNGYPAFVVSVDGAKKAEQ